GGGNLLPEEDVPTSGRGKLWSNSLPKTTLGGCVDITAAVANGPNAPFSIETLILEDPGQGEVLVEITAVGLCHTDIATRAGVIPFPTPGVLGHEGAGRVVQ